MKQFMLLLYIVAVGLTASGIIASLYRLAGAKAQSANGKMVRNAIMVFAGPVVLLETAIRGLRNKKWQKHWVWFATAGVAYWSLALGMFVLQIALSL